MKYKHTQVGYLMIAVLFVLALHFGFVLSRVGLDPFLVAVMLFVLFLLASFATLTVMIGKNYLRIKFGYGIFRKSFKLSEIASAKPVKNPWYHGWGVRIWFWPYMIIYNVSGYGAVELKMNNGRIYRIGTDEPKKLERAIKQAIMS